MKQYRIFLIFVALIFCELSSLGQISLLYDSITICQDGAFDLQKFQEDEVVVPVGYQLIGWKDVTSTIVIPSSSPTIYVLQYKELANPNVILTEELKVFLRSKPKLEITPSSPYKGARQSVCVGDRVKASITLVENADEYYWQHIETGNKYYTKDLDVEANLLNGNLMTFRAIATNQQCADLVQKEVVYAVLDPNSKAHFWLNEQNSSYPVLVQTKMVMNKQYCGNTYLSDLISLNQIQLPCRDYQFVCSYTPTYTESADIKLTKFELHWVELDDYTQGKLLDQDSVTYHCYITAEAYFKTCGVTRTYASDTITLNIKQLCEGVFSGFRYRCNERSKQGQFRFCTANLKKITNIEFINKTTPGKYIPDIKIKDSGANSFTSTDKYEDLATPGCPVPIFVNWDDDAPSELYYDVTFTYIGIDDNIRTYTYYNWKATPCVVDDILEYSVSNKQTSFYNLLSCDSYTFSSGEIRSSCYVKGKLSSPSVIKTSICNGSEAVIAFRVNQDSIWKVVWDCVEKPSAQTSMTYVMEHGKHTFSTTKNFSLTNYDKVTFTVSPTENTTYTGTVNGVPFAILVEIKEDRLAVTDTTICLGQSIDLKGLELATNINGVPTWNVSNTVVSPTVDTEYLIYGVGKKKCVDALDYARTDKTIVHVESQLWATSANLTGAKGSIVNLRNGLNTNGKNIVWYDSNNQEINSDTVIVSSEVKTYTAKIKNACGEKTVTIKVSPKADNTACTNGTLLFKEDFGGNEVTDPSISTTPIPQCNLNFKPDGNPKGAGNYVIRKFSYPLHNSWYPRLSDHTHPNDTARGYLMQVDGSATAGQFYICQIDNLCAEAELYLSVWGMGSCNSSSWTDASLTLVVKNLANIELGRQNITLEQGEGVWKQHGMPFKMPIGETSIIFSVINNTAAASGNDFMLDDIEVRLCTPPVIASIAPKDTVCGGDNVSIKGSFVNDGTFTEPLEYRWLYSTTGDLTSQTSWTTVGTNSTTLDMTSVQSNQSGYYRLAVASAGSIDLENCRAMSDPVHLVVNQCTHLVTVANDTIVASACDSVIIINLLNNDTYTCVIPQISLLTQPTVLGASVSIQNDSLVYALDSGHAALDSVQYAITCDGVSASAWVYIFVQSNSFITTEIFPNDTVCKGEYLLFSGKLTNGGTLELPVMYQWQKSYNGFEWTSVDSLGWTAFGTGTGNATTMFPTSHVGTTYYRLVIAEWGDYFLDDCFVTSSVIPIYVVQPTVDTLRLSGCGQVEYENTTFVSDSTFIIETQNAGGCTNELLVQITVRPEPLGEQTITDCDSVTYLGITYFHDTDLTERFSATGECDSLFVTHIDVDNCLSGYLVDDLIVNKYDWIVLCNNTKAKKLVPNYEEIHYQWFKDGQKLIGELDDYYTEDRLLFGCFFLRLLIMAEGQAYPFISETLCINHENLTISPNPVILSQYAVINYDFTEEEKSGLYVQIYNYLGVKITQFEPSSYPIYLPAGLPQGVYYVKVITGTNRIFGVKLIVN